MPVGLLGLARMTTAGCSSLIAAAAPSASIVKSARRGRVAYSVRVSRAYSGYMEYVGVKVRQVRPGPPKAWRTWSMTSLEPLAAQIRVGSSRTPDSAAR